MVLWFSVTMPVNDTNWTGLHLYFVSTFPVLFSIPNLNVSGWFQRNGPIFSIFLPRPTFFYRLGLDVQNQ